MRLSIEEEAKRRKAEDILHVIKEAAAKFDLVADFLQRNLRLDVSSEASMIVDDEVPIKIQQRVRFE